MNTYAYSNIEESIESRAKGNTNRLIQVPDVSLLQEDVKFSMGTIH